MDFRNLIRVPSYFLQKIANLIKFCIEMIYYFILFIYFVDLSKNIWPIRENHEFDIR